MANQRLEDLIGGDVPEVEVGTEATRRLLVGGVSALAIPSEPRGHESLEDAGALGRATVQRGRTDGAIDREGVKRDEFASE